MISHQKEATIEAVESLIQYKFKDSELVWEALHTFTSSSDANKRLAVIGDSVLQLALAEEWYKGGTSRGEYRVAPYVIRLLMHSLGHWANKIISKIGANANLDRQARALGLERFISGSLHGKAIADTVEAILGAIYLDSGMDKAKVVVDALDLLTHDRRAERELELEGLVELNDEDLAGPQLEKRRITKSSQLKLPFNPKPTRKKQDKKRLRLGHGRVSSRLGDAYSLPPKSLPSEHMANPASTSQMDFIEISD